MTPGKESWIIMNRWKAAVRQHIDQVNAAKVARCRSRYIRVQVFRKQQEQK